MTPIRMQHAAIACLGLAAAGASIWAAPGAPGLLGAGLALLMLSIAVIDARHLIIPNELNAAALALALINATVLAPSAVLEGFAAALSRGAVVMLLFLALRIAYRRLRGREGLGLGDVKLAFVAGAWLDWPMIPIAVEIAAVGALMFYGALRLRGKGPDPLARLPFGLFLAPAIWMAWLLGATVMGFGG